MGVAWGGLQAPRRLMETVHHAQSLSAGPTLFFKPPTFTYYSLHLLHYGTDTITTTVPMSAEFHNNGNDVSMVNLHTRSVG